MIRAGTFAGGFPSGREINAPGFGRRRRNWASIQKDHLFWVNVLLEALPPGPIEESKIPPPLDSTDSKSEILLHRDRKPWKSSFKILSLTAELEVRPRSFPEKRINLIQGDKSHFNACKIPLCKIQTNIVIKERRIISTNDS
jgi:hypothetical protein